MASTYTVNLGIEKIGTGEQSGTWGITTNTNFDLIDQAINGAVTVTLASAGTSGSPNTLAITDGTVSDGRNKFIDFADGGDLGAAAYVQLTPNDAEKLVHIRNSLSGGRSIFVFQGTYNASNDFEIPNGKDVVLKFDGGGATATVTQVFEDLLVTAVAATTVDTTNIEVTNLKAKDGTVAGSIADSTGVVTLSSSVLTTTDINGGSVDGVTLGTNSAVTEAQIDNININGNTISSTDTNGNVTITPDGTGSVAISKIDVAGGEIDGTAIGANSASTAVFTDLTASGTVSFSGATVSNGGTVTTINIDGGSIDGTIIGAATPAAGSFTTLTTSSTVTHNGGTANGVAYLNGSKVLTTGSALVFDGDNLGLGVVPSAWNSTYKAFQVGSSAALWSIGSGAGGSYLTNNVLFDSSFGRKYIVTGNATEYTQLNGQHQWFTAPSGTAGNAITFTERANIGTTEAVFNDPGNDYDFRVESDTNTHALFVDAGNNNVGINTSATGTTLAELTVGKAGDFPVLKISRTDSVYNTGVLALGDGNGTAVNVGVWRGNQNNYSAGGNYLNLHGYQGVSIASANAAAGSGVMGVFVAPNATVINDDGLDYDFRVESDTNANAFIVDASQDNVGIGGTPNLNTKLDVYQPVTTNQWTGRVVSRSDTASVWLGTYTSGSQSTTGIYAHDAVLTAWADLYINAHGDGSGGTSSGGTGQTIYSVGTWSHQGPAIFNDASGNFDFRVESDSNTHMLFVDAGNNRVGVGTSSPSQALDVNGTVLASSFLTATGTTGSLALNGTADIVNLSGLTGLWQVSVRNSDGGINWRNSSQVFFNGVSSSSVTTSDSANVTVTVSGTSIRLTNTNATSITLTWAITRLL